MKNNKTFRAFTAAVVSAALAAPCFIPAQALAATVYQPADIQELNQNPDIIHINVAGFEGSGMYAAYYFLNGFKEDGNRFFYTGVIQGDTDAVFDIPEDVNRDFLDVCVGYVQDGYWHQCLYAQVKGSQAIGSDVYCTDAGSISFNVLANGMIMDSIVANPTYAYTGGLIKTDGEIK